MRVDAKPGCTAMSVTHPFAVGHAGERVLVLDGHHEACGDVQAVLHSQVVGVGARPQAAVALVRTKVLRAAHGCLKPLHRRSGLLKAAHITSTAYSYTVLTHKKM
jgi:hypothetical protein